MAQQKNWRLCLPGFLSYSAHLFILLTIQVCAGSDIQAGGYYKTTKVTDSSAGAEREVDNLLQGRTITQEIVSGKPNFHQIEPSSGQFVHIVFEGRDWHFTIALLASSHRKILELNSLRLRPSSISFIADSPDPYILEVKFLEADEGVARYELTLDQVRNPVARDRDLIAAERASALAERLRAEWDSKSLLQSIDKYKEARAHWQATGNHREEAGTLKNTGEVYSILSRYQEALGYFNQALTLSRIAGDRRLEIETLNGTGEIQIEFGNWQSALDNFKQARALGKESDFIQGQAQALNNTGLVYHLLSDFPNALDSFDQALNLGRAAGDRRGQAQTLTNIGYSHGDLGNIQKSISSFNEALILWRRSKDLRGEAQTLTAIALLKSSQGEIQKSLETHDMAIRLFQKMGDKVGEAATLNALAYIYDTLGDKERAMDLYGRALRFYRAAGRRHSEAITMGLIGEMLYSLGDKQEALDYYNQKLSICHTLNDPRAEAHTLKDMGVVFDSSGDRDKALDYFNRALSLSRVASDPRAQAYVLNSIGHIYERLGQRDKALDYYKKAITFNRATEDRPAEAQTLHNIARVSRDLGDLKEAYDQSKALLDIVETLRTKVASQELRTSYFASAHQHYELYIDVLMRLHKLEPGAGYDAEALEASEKSRGRVLLDLLNEARADIQQGADPVLMRQERDLRQLLNAKAARQIRLLSGPHTDEQAAAVKKEVADITGQYEEVLTQIRVASARYASLTQPHALSLSDIQKRLLDPDTVLLEYSLGDERSYLWAVTPASAKAYELPARSKIEGTAVRLYRSLTEYGERLGNESPQQKHSTLEEASSQYSQASIELTRMLLEPVAFQLATKRLFIVADGALQYVPFAALPDPNGVNQGRQERQPLMVDHEIINLPSASIFSALRSEINERSPAPKTLAVMADPVFEKDDPRVGLKGKAAASAPSASRGKNLLRSDDLQGSLRFQRLPFASSEARAISDLVPDQERKLALGFDASLSTANSAELQQYRILHFATHGLIYGAYPQLYGVVLSLVDRQGNQQDGFLRLNEVYNMKLAADLVVLSACQTALGKDIKAEGLVGLVRGFMYAGAARVVASLWKVDDRATAELMKYFYEGLLGQRKLRPAAALRAAQAQMQKQPRWKSLISGLLSCCKANGNDSPDQTFCPFARSNQDFRRAQNLGRRSGRSGKAAGSYSARQ